MSTSSYSFVSCMPSTEDEFRSVASDILRLKTGGSNRAALLEASENLSCLSDYLKKLATGEIK